jgi:transketolase
MSTDLGTLRYVPREEFERILALEDRGVRAEAFAVAARLNTLYMIARAGSGHIGTSFSSLDIVTRLFLDELRIDSGQIRDLYFSSKGHDAPGLYSVLIGLGLLDFELLERLRRLGGLPGHPDIHTPHIVSNTGSLGMGISKAKGMAIARRRRGETVPIYVLLGDGELQEGQLWESLSSVANRGLSEVIAIVDSNGIQSDTWVEDVSDLGDLEAKVAAFGWAVLRCDGHDQAAIGAGLATLRDDPRPGFLIADTIKGRGVSFMEGTATPKGSGVLYRFHSGAPTAADYERAAEELERFAHSLLRRELVTIQVPREEAAAVPSTVQRLVAAYSRALVEAGRREPRLIALDADLVLDTGLIPFREAFPDRFVECGIAEQDMVSAAGGMALEGLLPAVHSFACFLAARPNEQIYNNATEGTKILYVGSLAGLLPGGPGHSHQSVRDISALGAMPGLVLLEPATEAEVAQCVDWAIASPQSVYLRLVSIPVDVPFSVPDEPLVEGRGRLLRPGAEILFAGAGPVVLTEAWHAAETCREAGLEVGVLELPFLNRCDVGWLEEIVGAAKLVIIDNHYIEGGQGAAIVAALARSGSSLAARTSLVGVEVVPFCGTNAEVLRAHRLDADSLAQRASAELR